MGEDLHKANLKFNEFINKIKTKRKVTKEEESLMYYAFIYGFNCGSGEVQTIK